MKTRTYLLLSLVIGFGIADVQADKPTEKYDIEADLSVPVMCDGQLFWISGYLYGQEVDVFDQDGELKTGINHVRGELTNEVTGEVFQVRMQYRGNWIDGYVIQQYNCKGSMGTHLNARLVWDVLAGWEFEFTKMNCH